MKIVDFFLCTIFLLLIFIAHTLSERKFYNECIFWSLKILHVLKIKDVGQRIRTIGHVSISYFALNDYKNCLEYGEKYMNHFDTLYKTDIKKINR